MILFVLALLVHFPLKVAIFDNGKFIWEAGENDSSGMDIFSTLGGASLFPVEIVNMLLFMSTNRLQ